MGFAVSLLLSTLLLRLLCADLLALPALINAKMINSRAAHIICALMLLAFLAKMAAVPFHHWMLEAQSEASTPVSMVLGSLLERPRAL